MKVLRRVLIVVLIAVLLTYGQLSFKYDSRLLMIALLTVAVALIDITSIMKERIRE